MYTKTCKQKQLPTFCWCFSRSSFSQGKHVGRIVEMLLFYKINKQSCYNSIQRKWVTDPGGLKLITYIFLVSDEKIGKKVIRYVTPEGSSWRRKQKTTNRLALFQMLTAFSFQVQHFGSCHQEWNGNLSHRRPQAYIAPTMHGHTFTLSHSSPNHTTGPHPHLGGHPHSQPTLLSYPPSGPLVTAAPMAHLLASPGASRPMLQPTYSISHPAGIVHQVTVGINPRLLSSPTLHPQGQFKPLFPPHSYIASPAYASFPLSPTKINQYPYIWAPRVSSTPPEGYG